jgi:hypothetical protein
MKTKDNRSDVKKKQPKKWSAGVTEKSDALDLKENVFESKSAAKIAGSLKKSHK